MRQTPEDRDLSSRIAEALVSHPGVADARVEPDHLGELVAYVVPVIGAVRVAAAGSCLLIEASGASVEGRLVDLSLAGVCVRVDGTPPAPGEEVQMFVEAEALGGGIEGWLGVVRWTSGDLVGLEFAGDFAEGATLARLVRAFAASTEDRLLASREIDARTRARAELDGEVRIGIVTVEGRTVDVSESGACLVLEGTGDMELVGWDVLVKFADPRFASEGIPGTVIHQRREFVGVDLAPCREDRAALRELIEQVVRQEVVTASALVAWVADSLPGASCRVELVDGVDREIEAQVPVG